MINLMVTRGGNTRQRLTVMASTSTATFVPSRYTRCVMKAEIGYSGTFSSPFGGYCEFNTEVIALRCLRSRSQGNYKESPDIVDGGVSIRFSIITAVHCWR
jgi:hypothetical protein